MKRRWLGWMLDALTGEMQETINTSVSNSVVARWRRGSVWYPNLVNHPDFIVQGTKDEPMFWIYVLLEA